MSDETQRPWDRVWIGADLATLRAGADPYGTERDAALAVRDGRIAWIGPAAEARARLALRPAPWVDATGLWITPGLIDCHTHLVYAGERAAEFEQRHQGLSYEQIARAGGGIQATVAATRAASDAELRASALRRARALCAEGVTTLEVKSGYGLHLCTERRQLALARDLERELPLSVRTTYLGLHALPPEFAHDRAGFLRRAGGEWL